MVEVWVGSMSVFVSVCFCGLGGVSRSQLIYGISWNELASHYSELPRICRYMTENKGLNPSASILWPSIQPGFSPHTHSDMRARMSIHDKYIIPTHTHTQTIKPSGLQFGELWQGFLLSLFLSCSFLSSSAFTAFACQQPHLAQAANPKLWWGGVSYLFGQAKMDLWIGEWETGRKKSCSRENGHPGMLRNNLPPSSSSLLSLFSLS